MEAVPFKHSAYINCVDVDLHSSFIVHTSPSIANLFQLREFCVQRQGSKVLLSNESKTPTQPAHTMSGPPAQALATHLINQTLSSLSVLETLEIISREDAARIRTMLPNAYGPFPSLNQPQSPQISHNFSQLSVGPASPPPVQVSPQPSIQSPIGHPQNSLVPSLPARAPVRESRARALWDYSGAVR